MGRHGIPLRYSIINQTTKLSCLIVTQGLNGAGLSHLFHVTFSPSLSFPFPSSCLHPLWALLDYLFSVGEEDPCGAPYHATRARARAYMVSVAQARAIELVHQVLGHVYATKNNLQLRGFHLLLQPIKETLSHPSTLKLRHLCIAVFVHPLLFTLRINSERHWDIGVQAANVKA